MKHTIKTYCKNPLDERHKYHPAFKTYNSKRILEQNLIAFPARYAYCPYCGLLLEKIIKEYERKPTKQKQSQAVKDSGAVMDGVKYSSSFAEYMNTKKESVENGSN